jgi:hypothetical protein
MTINDLKGGYKVIGYHPTGAPSAPVQAPVVPARNPVVAPVVDQFQSGVEAVKRGASTITRGTDPVHGAEAGLGIESGIASILTSPLAPLFAPVKAAVDFTADKVSDIPAVQKFTGSKAGQTTARIAEDLANAGNVAGTISGVAGAVKGAKAVGETAATMKGVSAVARELAPEATPNAKAIVDSYAKAVKPTTAGKTGPGQLDAYNNSVVSAVKSIAGNKDDLVYDNGDGNIIEAALPKTRSQFADAIEQTKQSIFRQYNDLTKQTTGQGVQIPLDTAGNALKDIIDNEALNLSHPEAVAYAKGYQQRFQNTDGSWKAVDPTTIEEVVTNFNADLKSFYRNPTYGHASRAAIDASIVHELRQALGDAIENATGENYSALKRQYGALASIEKDVNKAALAQLKQTGTIPSGIGKYIDIFSGGDMVSGLLSLNPALFAKGVAQGTFNRVYQYLNSPDRAVASMFKEAASTQ